MIYYRVIGANRMNTNLLFTNLYLLLTLTRRGTVEFV